MQLDTLLQFKTVLVLYVSCLHCPNKYFIDLSIYNHIIQIYIYFQAKDMLYYNLSKMILLLNYRLVG